MQLAEGRLAFSPSDLNDFLECEHLSALELAAARGALVRPSRDAPQAELIRRKGEEHERAYLAGLVAEGKRVVEIELGDDWHDAGARTEKEMRDGADVIYKFQGQDAPVVFFSVATSSGDDLVRSIGFLFSRNRLNVAISRAQALAVPVCCRSCWRSAAARSRTCGL
jgi:AAA domain